MSQWQVGVLHFLCRQAGKSDPSAPSNFRPIALTLHGEVAHCHPGDMLDAVHDSKRVFEHHLPKTFVDGVSGCTEHHVKLLSAIEEACQKRKSVAVCRLNLANALGRAPPTHPFLPGTLTCTILYGGSCLRHVPGTCWSCSH